MCVRANEPVILCKWPVTCGQQEAPSSALVETGMCVYGGEESEMEVDISRLRTEFSCFYAFDLF